MSLRDRIRALRLYYKAFPLINRAFANPVKTLLFPWLGTSRFTPRGPGRPVTVPGAYWTMLPSAARLVLIGAEPAWTADALRIEFQGLSFVSQPMDKSLSLTLKEIFIDDVYGLAGQDLRGMLVIDAGAYVGDSSIAFARCGARVHAFEPLPLLQPYLRENVRGNGFEESVTVHPVGLSDRPATVVLQVPTGGVAGTTLLATSGPDKGGDRVEQALELVDAVDFLEAHGLGDIHLFKLDCEGCEYALFADPRFWERFRPALIRMEFHRGGAPLAAILEQQGYVVDPYPEGDVGYINASLGGPLTGDLRP